MKLNNEGRFRMPGDDESPSKDNQPHTHMVELNPSEKEQGMMVAILISAFVREGCKYAVAGFCAEHKLEKGEAIRLWEAFQRGLQPKALDMIHEISSSIQKEMFDNADGEARCHISDQKTIAQSEERFGQALEADATYWLQYAAGNIINPDGFKPGDYMRQLAEKSGCVKPVNISGSEFKAAMEKLRDLTDKLGE